MEIRATEEQTQELPSVEPEIIRCKDCKWKQGAECVRFAEVRPFPDDFCSRAERERFEEAIDKACGWEKGALNEPE